MQELGLSPIEIIAIWSVFGVAILGLLYALFLRNQILREDMGTEKMIQVWSAIRDGADAYLRRQLRSILPLILVLTVAMYLSVAIVPPSPEAISRFGSVDAATLQISIGRAVGFILGATFSLIVGQVGMRQQAAEVSVAPLRFTEEGEVGVGCRTAD